MCHKTYVSFSNWMRCGSFLENGKMTNLRDKFSHYLKRILSVCHLNATQILVSRVVLFLTSTMQCTFLPVANRLAYAILFGVMDILRKWCESFSAFISAHIYIFYFSLQTPDSSSTIAPFEKFTV